MPREDPSASAATSEDEIVVDPRFCGPPESGNGGYVCGRLADYVEGDAVVRLSLPPPLAKPLRVSAADGSAEMSDGDARVATARTAPPETFDFAIPAAPDYGAARAAAERFQGLADHPFPCCFVCGPDRADGDGLRIFPAEVEGHPGVVASSWVPDASLADASGNVAAEFLWSALDCPGGMSFAQSEQSPSVLGEFAARVDGAVPIGERCVVIGWVMEASGRKHRTGTALFREDGECVARAVGTWIQLAASG